MIVVLRLGHRAGRDKRISTHAGLVARAFGADKIIYTGDRDKKLYSSLLNAVKRWGGVFNVDYEKDYKKIIKEYKNRKFKVVHLTMYGLPVQKQIGKIRHKNLLIIIGGEKVPPEVYELSDYNISVTSQPHSEIAALAILLDQYYEGKELSKKYRNADKKIKPSVRNKEFL